ncbi:hypothetical protein GN157_08290 [Flavobacterium rakeshii]|uniref:Uncharacterized protein n=1 Tax=Flavobacterium rakeshii TaxID=1038845 RepID=A0A6N8HEL6_9FLAO|nr:hypothetical protein [Flavobacterium rakeshii]MUV03707.1 hypothetical protein [Flavobacterium rakeshii]
MKKILSIMALAAITMSCSDDESNSEPEFFNLNQGSVWVYKKYRINNEGVEAFEEKIDSVTVSGTQMFDGEIYSRLVHKEYSGTNLVDEHDEFLRVNENGSLVNEIGYIIHSGERNYTFSYDRIGETELNGEMSYSLQEVKDVVVEGQNYTVYPYVGVFDHFYDDYLDGVATFYYFQKGIGKIVQHGRYMSSPIAAEEYRLISYDLK